MIFFRWLDFFEIFFPRQYLTYFSIENILNILHSNYFSFEYLFSIFFQLIPTLKKYSRKPFHARIRYFHPKKAQQRRAESNLKLHEMSKLPGGICSQKFPIGHCERASKVCFRVYPPKLYFHRTPVYVFPSRMQIPSGKFQARCSKQPNCPILSTSSRQNPRN